jgi:hypothetical protein
MKTSERIQAAIRQNPNQMTMLLAKQFGVAEAEIIRAFPDDRAIELDPLVLSHGLLPLQKFYTIAEGVTELEPPVARNRDALQRFYPQGG